MARFHLHYGCLRPTSPSTPQARTQVPAIPRLRARCPGKGLATTIQHARHTNKHIPPRIVTLGHYGSLQVTSQHVHKSATRARKTLDTHTTQKWNAIISKMLCILSANRYNDTTRVITSNLPLRLRTSASTQWRHATRRNPTYPKVRNSTGNVYLAGTRVGHEYLRFAANVTEHSMNNGRANETHEPSDDHVLGDPSDRVRRLKSQQQPGRGRVLCNAAAEF